MAKNSPNQKASSPSASLGWDAFFHQPLGVGLLCAALFGLVVWTFWPSLQGEFIFHDDYGTLVVNNHVNQGLTWPGVVWAISALEYNQWIPLTWVSHMLDFQLYGPNPWGHHLTNVLLHAASSVFVFLMLRSLTGSLWRSLIVAELFAFHPLRVESVAWICERKDVLSVFWGLLAVWAYAVYAKRVKAHGGKQGWFYGLTYLLFALSLLSKQTFITFPCVLLLLDFWPLDRLKTGNYKRLILEKIPFFVVLPFVSKLSYLSQLRGGALNEMVGLSFTARLDNALVSYVKYVRKFFCPTDLSIFYPHPGTWPMVDVVLAGLFLVAVSLVAWLYCRRWPWLFVGWFWFVGVMVPVLGFVQLYSLAMADRFTYLPEVGLTVAVVWGVWALTKAWKYQVRFAWVTSGVLLVLLIAMTRYQIGFWKDEMTLLKRAVAVNDNNYVAHYLLGYFLTENDPDAAYAEIQKCVAINPHYFQAQLYLGDYEMQHGHPETAITHYKISNPNDMRSVYGWGMACYQLGDVDQAIQLFERGITNDPYNIPPKNKLVEMLVQKNRLSEAIPVLQSVCALTTNDPIAYNNLGIVLARDNQFDAAIQAFQTAVKLEPDSAQLKGNLTIAINAKAQAAASINTVPATSTNSPPAQ